MAVVSVKELPGRSGSTNGAGATVKRRWYVTTSERTDDAMIVLAAEGIGVPGQPHDYSEDEEAPDIYAALICTGVEAEEQLLNLKEDEESGDPIAAGSSWIVTADYSSIQTDIEATLSPLYPTQKAKYNGNATLEFRPTDYDKNGDVITNLAGDLFNPAVQAWFPNETLEIEVNLAFADLPNSSTYLRKTNAATYKGKAAGTVMCVSCTICGPFTQAGVEYYTAKLSLAHAEETWDVRHGKILHRGLRELINGKLYPCIIEGREITEPLPLKHDDFDFDDIVAIIDGDMSAASWLEVELYPQTSYTGIDY